MSLTVQTEQRGDMVVVSGAGELDMATAPQLQDQISDLLEKGRTRLIFDLAVLGAAEGTWRDSTIDALIPAAGGSP